MATSIAQTSAPVIQILRRQPALVLHGRTQWKMLAELSMTGQSGQLALETLAEDDATFVFSQNLDGTQDVHSNEAAESGGFNVLFRAFDH